MARPRVHGRELHGALLVARGGGRIETLAHARGPRPLDDRRARHRRDDRDARARGATERADARRRSADRAPTTRASAAARPLDNDMQRAKLVRNWGIVTLASGVALVGVGAGFEVWRLGHAPCKDVKISDRVETCNRDMAAHATLITIASGIAILGA